MKKILLLSALIMGSSVALAAPSDSIEMQVEMSVPPIRLNADFVYAETYNNMGRPIKLSMDVIQPFSPEPLPAVLFVTGGGFMDAPKTKFIGQRVDMARAGYVVASIDYRVVPMVTFPGMLEDIKSAVRYMRANAKKFGIDPDRIAIMGESAGGYLAAIAATTNGMKEFDKGANLDQSSDVQAAIDLYGLSDLTRVGADYSAERQKTHESPAIPEAMLVNGIPFQAGGSILSDLDKAAYANPITHISKNTPPFLLMHGDADPIVSPSQTKILHDALVDKGIDSTRYVIKGADHAGFLWYQPEIMDTIIEFLDENLK
ncbi:alpha/beta hydrolase [Photobacterium rosenbergii]|uniref:Alpha/beta hydrolase n=1 Tax=Photobacterium rosenbergii TaxID=294936 RepID=A0ABU3ZNC6_9GAMM|nr:alpha/beta hydrolase [Photobacterium rosenbergii]MDV5171617.1 alpha/beta hydrolase [Photobacterium rosenbergii]